MNPCWLLFVCLTSGEPLHDVALQGRLVGDSDSCDDSRHSDSAREEQPQRVGRRRFKYERVYLGIAQPSALCSPGAIIVPFALNSVLAEPKSLHGRYGVVSTCRVRAPPGASLRAGASM